MYIKPVKTLRDVLRVDDRQAICFDPTRDEWVLSDFDPEREHNDIRPRLAVEGCDGLIFVGPDDVMWFVNSEFAVTRLGVKVMLGWEHHLTSQSQSSTETE